MGRGRDRELGLNSYTSISYVNVHVCAQDCEVSTYETSVDEAYQCLDSALQQREEGVMGRENQVAGEKSTRLGCTYTPRSPK